MKKLIYIFALLLFASSAFAIEVDFENDPALPIVNLNVVVKTGSVSDPNGLSGITNFMAEMLLRGTKSKSKEQIDLELDQMGAKLEVETRAEALILRGTVLSRELDPFLRLLGEIVTQPTFPEGEIKKLKSQVVSGILEELGKDNSLGRRRFEKFLFKGHPYGKPVLGTVKNVEALTRGQVQEQYDRLIRDRHMLVVGAGDGKEEKIRTWAYGIADARHGGEDLNRVETPEDAGHRRLILIDKPDRTQTQIYAGQIGLKMTDAKFFPLFVANHAFGGGSFSARMMVEIRVKRGWSYGAYSYFRHGVQPKSWSLYLFPAAKDTAPALEYSLQMLSDLHDHGITSDEFNFAKQSLINSAGFMFNTPKKRVENKVLERTLQLPDGIMKSYATEIEKVTLEQANLALKEYIKPKQLSILVLATATKETKDKLAKAAGVSPERVEVVKYTEE